MSEIERYRHKDSIIVIEYDDDGWHNSPRDWDNSTTMLCAHRNYDLGDKIALSDIAYGLEDLGHRRGWAGIARYLTLFCGVNVWLPLGLYDHSGISMYVGSGPHAFDSQGWDSGMVGIIYMTPEQAEGWPAGHDLHAVLREDVEVYNAYLRGEVYRYTVYTDFPDTIDDEPLDLDELGDVDEAVISYLAGDYNCCGGYYDIDHCKAEAELEAS